MSVGSIGDVARLRLVVVRLARRIRQHSEAGLTPTQLSALSTLDRHGEMRLGRLAERERISRPSVTRLVSKLEEKGYIQLSPDPEDGRSSRVRLSTSGRALVYGANRRSDAYLARQVAGLSDEDRRILGDAVSVLEHVLNVKL